MLKAIQEFGEALGIDTKIYTRSNSKGTMDIMRMDPVTREFNERTLPISKEQFDSWMGGELIQNVMPDLSISDREFLISGMNSLLEDPPIEA